ncbi:MAG: chromate transporter [Oscillospiraceae bacterium]
MNVYLALFVEFFKTGLFAIGGGLATLPFLYDIADKYSWFDRAMLIDMVAIAESTPGPIGVNMATYAGFCAASVSGGIVATFALMLPSFFIMVIICKFLARFSTSSAVKGMFYGLRPAVTGLIAAAGLSVVRVALLTDARFNGFSSLLSLANWPAVALFVILYILYMKYQRHPIFYILGAAAVGILFKM